MVQWILDHGYSGSLLGTWGLELTTTTEESTAKYCWRKKRKGNSTAGFINRNIVCKSEEVNLPLCSALVRPYLEYDVQGWALYFKEVVDKLKFKNKQTKRTTKMKRGLDNMTYKERLEFRGLFDLEKRKIKGHLITTIFVFKDF